MYKFRNDAFVSKKDCSVALWVLICCTCCFLQRRMLKTSVYDNSTQFKFDLLHLYIYTYIHAYTYIIHMFIFADYEDIASASVTITNSDIDHGFNLTIFSDADLFEENETIVIGLSVGFKANLHDADIDSLQSRIFFDPPTTTITIVDSGKTYSNASFPL